ncbi:MAG: nucleotide exchange factor GrpE [Bacteroidales bacterium]|jgi:molecular chaperone GrpE|nr:nucleotide exchange factor GrpE [Bacteroidales bacterium]
MARTKKEKKSSKDNELENAHSQQENVVENDEQVEAENEEENVESIEVEDTKTALSPEEIFAQERDEFKDKYIRLAAEFDNYRRRTLKEKSDLIKSGGELIFVNMLPVIDDFDRAMEAAASAEDVNAVKEGIALISNKFKNFLNQNGVQEIDAKEQDFDTDKHEAITKIPAPSDDLKGKVVDVIEKGYEMHEKVIRFAKVVVGE